MDKVNNTVQLKWTSLDKETTIDDLPEITIAEIEKMMNDKNSTFDIICQPVQYEEKIDEIIKRDNDISDNFFFKQSIEFIEHRILETMLEKYNLKIMLFGILENIRFYKTVEDGVRSIIGICYILKKNRKEIK